MEAAVRQVGVPDEEVAAQAAALASLYQPVQERAHRVDLSLVEARGLLSSLASAKMEKERKLQELRAAYTVQPYVQEVRLKWQDIAGRATINSEEELDETLARIRERVLAELGEDRTIVLE